MNVSTLPRHSLVTVVWGDRRMNGRVLYDNGREVRVELHGARVASFPRADVTAR